MYILKSFYDIGRFPELSYIIKRVFACEITIKGYIMSLIHLRIEKLLSLENSKDTFLKKEEVRMAIIKLSCSNNIRDLGGIKTTDGRTVKKGLFIRCGCMNNLNENDISVLKDEYHLKTIIDLRTGQEQLEKPDVLIPGVEYLSIPVFEEATIGITREIGTDIKNLEKNNASKEELRAAIPDMVSLYPKMFMDEYSLIQIKKIILCIMKNVKSGSVLFHCTAGKDRTGVIAMIILHILGVPKEEILKDYLLTNKITKREANKYYLLALFFKHDLIIAQKLRKAYLADASYLQSVYDVAKKECGSLDKFIRDRLNVTDEMIDEFKGYALT